MHAVDVARCLDAHGDNVQVWGCNGTAAQKWAPYRVPGHNSRYEVVNRDSHCCLDAEASGSGQDGQTVQGFGCAGSSNQVWTWAT
ncbi:RICIN domain-containing protein [Streptomyces sp. NPDC051576]|uniref:RICIN domain-containing protein n=1 Tax=Streptomyces sp. NPDC051576 TaxID=3155803 RepID=UPI00343327F0